MPWDEPRSRRCYSSQPSRTETRSILLNSLQGPEARRLQEQSFAVGLSTNLAVIQYQNYLAQARSTEVASKGAYIKAKIALERATGTTLESHHVAIDEAYRGSVTR